ncbi:MULTISPECIES: multiheme c-type cytochrome [Aliivibrio]|uniref:Tetratricopeptide repeat protein n=1 Tax=Aliivibrio finisterrensis TaxID=511998 RepID=A0A4Q5KW16_9GAMM|nr:MULTISPECIES: multiheme c-type cytochrome [Aliivibrio]MDD9177658.1 multiheme c-type cytochrome [Aliivibrio sp. A6]RYU51268.1 tetratricopeptide repeat protein [Aliivibrio finisterrensis]RYU54465.1 tetratricopeptide repeat protein [Aliivibrio finisterrensis]RYU59533.1 tetratricopeptide repeat protein [Aliivibrio finisterrensis]RYU65452.1 tetratricopeptide repeat protein [Aliivibrio finisterrensis]
MSNKIITYALCVVWISIIGFSSNTVAADFVGNETCVDCHKEEVEAWIGSDHDMAMKHADKDSVYGDFNDAIFEFKGKPNRFFKKGDEYWVNIEGPDGKFNDYQISYTFGFEPLQQYMVEFDDGRIQLIPFAWDSRSAEEGGQRWYHLYPEMEKTDEFYWTNTGQNWNFMCADCHSTDVKKNYDAKTDTYNTSWFEINVGCEACHGPASEHITWSKNQTENKNPHYGFDRDLSKSVKEWVFKEGHTTLQPKQIQATDQITMCAQCHSRRTQLNEDQAHIKGDSKTLLDSYLPSLITAELYHNDGQIYDEDYVYGSFMQSKMAKKGVTCSNCHNPHSTKLDIPEQAVCSQCHIASEYTPEKHTFHEANTEASQCTTCHMPETTYMGVDARRDHSWQIPRPDLSKNIGTPNVCTQCHEDKDDSWADKQIGQWFPDSPYRNQQHFAVAFYASDINYRGAGDALSYTAQDAKQAGIIRGSALQRLSRFPSKNTLVALGRAIKHDDELIRLGAVQGSAGYSAYDRWQILSPLLTDNVLAIRSEAAGALAAYWSDLNPLQKEQLTAPLNEYINIQLFNADRGFGRTNLGNVYRSQGKLEKAEQAYLGAIEIEPYFINSYVNLADMYRTQGKENKELELLKEGIKAQPNSGALPYSTGLALLRLEQKKEASQYFRKAAEIEKQNSQYWYVYGLSMEPFDGAAAAQALNQAFELSGDPQHLFAQCDMLLKNQLKKAAQCITQLEQYAPKNVIDALKQRL